MPVFYVYSPDDFVGGLPDERGAKAKGGRKQELTLKEGAKPTRIEVKDDDGVFDEVDYNQSITSDVDLDGTEYSAGTSIQSAYDLVNSSSGLKVTSIHIGGNGYQQGAVDGLISSEPLEPGKTYKFDINRTSHRKDNDYDDYVACFAQDTLIKTERGEVKVQDLKPGDRVARFDGGFATLRLALSRSLGAGDLARNAKLRPVRIVAGAMGRGMPHRDLLVSPQHRMLANSPVCKRMFGQAEVFVSARKMTTLSGVFVDESQTQVDYYHLVFDAHEVIFAEGTPTESFYVGPNAMLGLSPDAKEELLALFPELAAMTQNPQMARFAPADKAQKHLMQRHAKNHKALLV